MKNIENYKSGNYAIHCNSQIEWDYITKLLGYNWNEGHWGKYKENTAINCGMQGYSPLSYYTKENYTILEAKDFMEEEFPEKWVISGKYDEVREWFSKNRTDGINDYGTHPGYKINYFHSIPVKNNVGNYYHVNGDGERINSKFTEITLEQFQKYVLKQDDKPMDEIKYTLEYCKANKIAVEVPSVEIGEQIAKLIPGKHETWKYFLIDSNLKWAFRFDDGLIINSLNGFEPYYKNEYKIISAEQFIKDNTKETMQKLTVKKSEFKKVHDVACDTWKKKCKEYASKDPFSDEITFTQQQVDEMFEAAQSHQLLVLEEVFGKRDNSICSSTLDVGDIMELNKIEQNTKYLLRTYDALIGFTEKGLHTINQSWDKKSTFKGKKLPKGTKIEIIAG